MEEGPGVIPEGGLEGLDTEAASAPKAAASDGALPVKEELDVSPGGSPPSVPDAEPAAAAAAAAPEVARRRHPGAARRALRSRGGPQLRAPPHPRISRLLVRGDTRSWGYGGGQHWEGAGRPPKSGLKKSRLGPASGTGTEVKRGVGRPARVILGPDGTPLPKSHKKKVDPGSEGTKSKPKPPPPPPRQLTRAAAAVRGGGEGRHAGYRRREGRSGWGRDSGSGDVGGGGACDPGGAAAAADGPQAGADGAPGRGAGCAWEVLGAREQATPLAGQDLRRRRPARWQLSKPPGRPGRPTGSLLVRLACCFLQRADMDTLCVSSPYIRRIMQSSLLGSLRVEAFSCGDSHLVAGSVSGLGIMG